MIWEYYTLFIFNRTPITLKIQILIFQIIIIFWIRIIILLIIIILSIMNNSPIIYLTNSFPNPIHIFPFDLLILIDGTCYPQPYSNFLLNLIIINIHPSFNIEPPTYCSSLLILSDSDSASVHRTSGDILNIGEFRCVVDVVGILAPTLEFVFIMGDEAGVAD